MQKLNITVNLPFPSDVVWGTVLRKEISWISIVTRERGGVITTHVKTTKHATEGNYSSYGGHRSSVFESPEFPVEFGTNRQFLIHFENTSPWIGLQCECIYIIRLN